MRGLCLLVLLSTTIAVAYSNMEIPDISNMSPYEIDREMRSFVDRIVQRREQIDMERTALEDAIIEFTYWFQDHMAEGFPKFGIPVLDPLFLARTINYNLTSDLMDVHGYIAQTTIQNMSTFEVTYVEVNSIRMQLSWNWTWPEINMGGLYDVDGSLTILPIYGTGPFTLSMKNFSLWGTLDLAVRLNGSLVITDIPMDLYLGALENNFEGMMGGGEMGQIVNDMITDMGPILLDSVAQQILVPIGNVLMNRINPILAPYTVSEIVAFLMSFLSGTTTAAP